MDDLAPKRAVTHTAKARLQRIEHLGLAEIRKLFAKTLEVAKDVVVDEADQAEEFEK